LSKVLSGPSRRHFQVKNTAHRPKITVSADGPGIVYQAGTLLLTEAVRLCPSAHRTAKALTLRSRPIFLGKRHGFPLAAHDVPRGTPQSS
jgi:hypothetical protein